MQLKTKQYINTENFDYCETEILEVLRTFHIIVLFDNPSFPTSKGNYRNFSPLN